MSAAAPSRRVVILVVDDSPTDVMMVSEALSRVGFMSEVHVVEDGLAAIDFLMQRRSFAGAPRPDLVLLDLNLPRMDGRVVLAEVKGDARLAAIPVIVLTTSRAPDDIASAYALHANCYIAKPLEFERLEAVVCAIARFWFDIVSLPGPMRDRDSCSTDIDGGLKTSDASTDMHKGRPGGP